MIAPAAVVSVLCLAGIAWRQSILWRSGAKSAAVYLFLLTLYSFVPLWLAYHRQDVMRRVVPELAGRALPRADDAAAFIGLSILIGALLIRRRPEVAQHGDADADDTPEPARWLLVLALSAIVMYLFGSNVLRWKGASYVNNDIIKSNRIDAALLTLFAVALGSMIGLRFFARVRWAMSLIATALLVVSAVLLLWTMGRIGARAQVLYFVAGAAPFVGTWAFDRRSPRFLGRLVGVIGVLIVLVVAVAALRVMRSPLYENQGLLESARLELSSSDAIVDQDYSYPGIPLLVTMAGSAPDDLNVVAAEVGATFPGLPGENLSIQFARSIGAERAARNEGFGSTPLLTGFVLLGWFGFLANAVLIWSSAWILEAFTRSASSQSSYLVALGVSFGAALYSTRSEFGGVIFFLAVFGAPTLVLIRVLSVRPTGKRTRRPEGGATSQPGGVVLEAGSRPSQDSPTPV